nr:hypothetical protein CFP56_11610 [Quercus suber]
MPSLDHMLQHPAGRHPLLRKLECHKAPRPRVPRYRIHILAQPIPVACCGPLQKLHAESFAVDRPCVVHTCEHAGRTITVPVSAGLERTGRTPARRLHYT